MSKPLWPSNKSSTAGKTLIKVGPTEFAEAGQVGVQTNLEQLNSGVRDSPSLVWGRPAKSVVERPRGFNSHIPRHILMLDVVCALIGIF